ncbi:MAG: transcriptional regulator [Bacteroidetes bacterium]|nr:MAG: transcriptional regulator [Bacteroidota bacterium]
MGITRTDLHEDIDLELSGIAKALAHPARIAIIRCLLQSKTCITGDLTGQIGLSQPTISQHLKELKAVGIIQGTISGTAVKYCINGERWHEIARMLADLFAEFPNDKCC